MDKKIFIPIGGGVVILVIALILAFETDKVKIDLDPSLSLDFNYEDANSNLKKTLENSKISMSSPIQLSKIDDIKKFCTLTISKNFVLFLKTNQFKIW